MMTATDDAVISGSRSFSAFVVSRPPSSSLPMRSGNLARSLATCDVSDARNGNARDRPFVHERPAELKGYQLDEAAAWQGNGQEKSLESAF